MSVLPILTWPDARLSEVCAPVRDTAEVAGLAADMFETMYAAPGRGLAAPQVGVMLRLFVMDPTWKEGTRTPLVCINPEIVEASAEVASNNEACLSIPGVSAEVSRPVRITLAYTDLDGERRLEVLSGFAATCAQHEIDHLDGCVILDRLSRDRRAQVEADYAALT